MHPLGSFTREFAGVPGYFFSCACPGSVIERRFPPVQLAADLEQTPSYPVRLLFLDPPLVSSWSGCTPFLRGMVRGGGTRLAGRLAGGRTVAYSTTRSTHSLSQTFDLHFRSPPFFGLLLLRRRRRDRFYQPLRCTDGVNQRFPPHSHY